MGWTHLFNRRKLKSKHNKRMGETHTKMKSMIHKYSKDLYWTRKIRDPEQHSNLIKEGEDWHQQLLTFINLRTLLKCAMKKVLREQAQQEFQIVDHNFIKSKTNSSLLSNSASEVVALFQLHSIIQLGHKIRKFLISLGEMLASQIISQLTITKWWTLFIELKVILFSDNYKYIVPTHILSILKQFLQSKVNNE